MTVERYLGVVLALSVAVMTVATATPVTAQRTTAGVVDVNTVTVDTVPSTEGGVVDAIETGRTEYNEVVENSNSAWIDRFADRKIYLEVETPGGEKVELTAETDGDGKVVETERAEADDADDADLRVSTTARTIANLQQSEDRGQAIERSIETGEITVSGNSIVDSATYGAMTGLARAGAKIREGKYDLEPGDTKQIEFEGQQATLTRNDLGQRIVDLGDKQYVVNSKGSVVGETSAERQNLVQQDPATLDPDCGVSTDRSDGGTGQPGVGGVYTTPGVPTSFGEYDSSIPCNCNCDAEIVGPTELEMGFDEEAEYTVDLDIECQGAHDVAYPDGMDKDSVEWDVETPDSAGVAPEAEGGTLDAPSPERANHDFKATISVEASGEGLCKEDAQGEGYGRDLFECSDELEISFSSDCDSLQDEIDRLKDRLNELEDDKAEKEDELEDLEEKLDEKEDELESQIEDLEQELKEKEKELDKAENKLSIAEARRDKKKRKYDKQKAELDRLVSAKNDFEAERDAKQNQLDRLTRAERLHSFFQEHGINKCKERAQNDPAFRRDVFELSQATATGDAGVDKVNARQACNYLAGEHLGQNLRPAIIGLANLVTMIGSAPREILADLTLNTVVNKAYLNDLLAQDDLSPEERNELREDLENDIEELDKAINELEQKIEAQREETQEARAEFEESQEKVDELQDEVDDHQSEVSSLEQKLQDLKNEDKSFEETMKERIEEKQDKIEEIEGKIEDVESKLEQLCEECRNNCPSCPACQGVGDGG